MSGVSPQTNHGVCSNVSRLLLQFPEQFIPHVTRQLGQALDFSPDETLEAGANVTEHVPALDLAGQDEALVLQALAHAGLIGVTIYISYKSYSDERVAQFIPEMEYIYEKKNSNIQKCT